MRSPQTVSSVKWIICSYTNHPAVSVIILLDLCSAALDHVMSHYLPIGTVHFKIKFRLNDYDYCMSQLPTFVVLSSQCSQ